MSDSPPPYVPGKSSFTRFLNWTMPAVGVPIEQLRPDPTYVQLILGAVYDIRICQEIFDGWATQLDKLRTKKFEERERVLRHHLTLLREDVGYCSRATDAILLCHAQFAYLMAQRIDDASRLWLKGLKYGQDTTRLANEINKASRLLSQHVAHMQGNLKLFVSALEKMEVQKKSSTARRILGWLKYLFNALASIFALGSFVSPFLHTVAPGLSLIAPAASTLWKAAAAFCGQASEMRAGKESESIESVLLFLKDIVPKEAHIAQKSLARFDEALLVMGLEARMKTGRRVALRGPNPDLTAVAQEWRKIAKQYQSMLPDDEDPDG
ncbi:hypothetical protein EDB84DRAFT_1561285 [Lactarius hengduanensis]|nr:hypothetical protein EDB84DRAFT_1561285 [Lactarius hengduanensis]KAH9035026.1 hypothetical protein EDB85DRAFT_1889530 [Lactarius pseudohatsudake]